MEKKLRYISIIEIVSLNLYFFSVYLHILSDSQQDPNVNIKTNSKGTCKYLNYKASLSSYISMLTTSLFRWYWKKEIITIHCFRIYVPFVSYFPWIQMINVRTVSINPKRKSIVHETYFSKTISNEQCSLNLFLAGIPHTLPYKPK